MYWDPKQILEPNKILGPSKIFDPKKNVRTQNIWANKLSIQNYLDPKKLSFTKNVDLKETFLTKIKFGPKTISTSSKHLYNLGDHTKGTE